MKEIESIEISEQARRLDAQLPLPDLTAVTPELLTETIPGDCGERRVRLLFVRKLKQSAGREFDEGEMRIHIRFDNATATYRWTGEIMNDCPVFELVEGTW